MAALTIRQYEPQDADAVWSLHERALRDVGAFDPDHYRRGFGSRVLDELECRALDRGFETPVLDTTPTQQAAVAFYEARGYERRARLETDHGPVLLYRRDLGQRF